MGSGREKRGGWAERRRQELATKELGRRGLSAACWHGTLEELHWHGTREISGAWQACRRSRKTVPGSCCLLASTDGMWRIRLSTPLSLL